MLVDLFRAQKPSRLSRPLVRVRKANLPVAGTLADDNSLFTDTNEANP
jgi:hypothetical protein